jgi:hypothetical protein
VAASWGKRPHEGVQVYIGMYGVILAPRLVKLSQSLKRVTKSSAVGASDGNGELFVLLDPFGFFAQHPGIGLLASLYSLLLHAIAKLRPAIARTHDFLSFCDQHYCDLVDECKARRGKRGARKH